MPHQALGIRGADEGTALAARLTRLRQELELPSEFPADVLAEAERAAAEVLAALPGDTDRVDLTGMPFVTVDPAGSTDLDQALHIERTETGLRVHYAIADVPAFVATGGAVDAEARRRGQTVYLPDGRVPLHPVRLSEDAGSLLPEQERPAFVWTMDLDAEGVLGEVGLVRARVRSRAQLTYVQVQALVGDGTPVTESFEEGAAVGTGTAADAEVPELPEEILSSLRLLPEVGRLRRAQEAARGGASLNMPDQEIHVDSSGAYRLVQRVPLPVEDDNAHVSLMTGMAAARIMLEGGVGVLRTMPAPDEEALAEFRSRVAALGAPWTDEQDYGAYLRTVDPATPQGLAVLHAATALFRGADYSAFDAAADDPELRTPPEDPEQAALAAPYAHTTAPLRRLVDRFVLIVCHALVQGAEVPADVRAALPELPSLMADSGRRASQADRAAVDLVEAAELTAHVGEELEGTVVRRRGEDSVDVQLIAPPAYLSVPGAAEPGDAVRVHIDAVDVATGEITASLAAPS